MVNSTLSPSFSVLYPSLTIAESCTKMSPPEALSINPNPFLLLNHLTLPCSLLITLRLLFYNYNTPRSLSRRALYRKSLSCQLSGRWAEITQLTCSLQSCRNGTVAVLHDGTRPKCAREMQTPKTA